MNLLNRYLQAVAKGLPKARRDDIVEELRANLLSQMEDREESLGRALNEDELADILRRHGSPTLVAGRYRDDNLGFAFGFQIVGPELFPYYRTVLGIVLGISLVLLCAVMPMVAQATGIDWTWGRALKPLVIQFVVVTGIFFALDRGKGHWLNQWDPRKLPAATEPNDYTIFGFISLAIGTLWLALTPHWPFLVLGPGGLVFHEVPFQFMPRWMEFYWAIIALLCAQLAVQLFSLLHWLSRRHGRIADLTLKAVGLGIGVLLLIAGPNYVMSQYDDLAKWANLSFRVCILVALAIQIGGFIRRLMSLLRERDQMLPARQN